MSEIRNSVDAFASSWAGAVIKMRWLVLFTCLVLTVLAASGASHLSFATNYRVFFSPQNPDLAAFEELQATYTKNDNFFIAVSPINGDVFTQETLAAVEALTEKAWTIPYSIRVDSITNFQYTYANGDELIVEDLVRGTEALSADELAHKREIALAEPLLRDQLITSSADVTAINVVLQYPDKRIDEVPVAVAYAREVVAEIEANHPAIDIELSGVSVLNNAFSEAALSDLSTLTPAMYVLLLVVMLLTVRSLSATGATLLVIMFSTMAAMGVGGFMAIKLTPMSAAAPVIILTLAIADSIHILITMRARMRDGLAKKDAIIDALRTNFLAVSITSLTTIIGFLALNFSDSPPFHHLGNISAVGIAFAWFFSITLLPAVVSILPMKAPKAGGRFNGADAMEAIANLVIGNSRKFLLGMSLASLVLIAMIPSLKFEDQWIEYFDKRLDIRTASDAVSEHFGLYPVEFSVTANGPGGVSEPEYLQALDEFAVWLRAHRHISHVYSITDIMKRLNKNLHADDPEFYRLPDSRNLSAQYLLLYELSLPYGLDLNDRINIDKSASRITATMRKVATSEARAFIEESQAWIDENFPAYMTAEPTGAQVMFTYVAERNVHSMIRGNIIAVIVIAIIMVLALRSLGLGLVSLIPNGLPILATFGAWALLVGSVGFSIAAVGAVSLGIVVDDTVHFLTKYVRGLKEQGLSRADAIRYAFRTVGVAILVNTIVLASGFCLLIASAFKLNVDLGMMTALSIVFALILDFFLLPAILMNLPQSKQSKNATS